MQVEEKKLWRLIFLIVGAIAIIWLLFWLFAPPVVAPVPVEKPHQTENLPDISSSAEPSPPQNQNQNTDQISPLPELYPVTQVVDGDTIKVKIGDKIETIRLIGIDAPESVDPRRPVQCFGQEAAARAKELLLGKKVSLRPDPTQGEKDKYGRLLRYVYLEDGTFFNLKMIEEGFAHEYTYKKNPYEERESFIAASNRAKAAQIGLWSPQTCAK